MDETNETVTVSGTSGSLTVNSATISLTDDDDAPTAITLTVNDNSVGEGDGATTITVTATVDGATRFAEATTVSVNVGGQRHGDGGGLPRRCRRSTSLSPRGRRAIRRPSR